MTPLEYVNQHLASAVKRPLGTWLLDNPLPCYLEPKFDGRRTVLFVSGGKAVYATKHNGLYTRNNRPELFSILPAFRARTLILDCEAYPKGRPDRVAAFDALEEDGLDLTQMRLSERKDVLFGLFDDGPNFRKVVPIVATTSERVLELKRGFIEQGFEGAMAKNPLSRYGEAGAWLKLKKNDTGDFVILRPDPDNDTYRLTGVSHSWFIGLYDGHGQIEEWGKVGNYVEGVDPALIKEGTVVEIQYQETTEGKRLRDPFILRPRDDKLPSECRTEQVE
jgi:ATP-dependent DNA ligase